MRAPPSSGVLLPWCARRLALTNTILLSIIALIVAGFISALFDSLELLQYEVMLVIAGAGFIAFSSWLGIRSLRISVRIEADRIEIRNPFRTYRTTQAGCAVTGVGHFPMSWLRVSLGRTAPALQLKLDGGPVVVCVATACDDQRTRNDALQFFRHHGVDIRFDEKIFVDGLTTQSDWAWPRTTGREP